MHNKYRYFLKSYQVTYHVTRTNSDKLGNTRCHYDLRKYF